MCTLYTKGDSDQGYFVHVKTIWTEYGELIDIIHISWRHRQRDMHIPCFRMCQCIILQALQMDLNALTSPQSAQRSRILVVVRSTVVLSRVSEYMLECTPYRGCRDDIRDIPDAPIHRHRPMGSKSTQHSGAMDGREAELMGVWIRELTLCP